MFGSVLLTALWGLATAFIDSGLDQHWLLWKKLHSKVYSDEVQVVPFNAATCRTCWEAQRSCVMWNNVDAVLRLRTWVAGGSGRITWK